MSVQPAAPWSIASPCDERWEAMTGDDRVRHCARCSKNVVDLSAHSIDEARAFRASATPPCLRLTQRADGAVRVREGWWLRTRGAALATALAACSPSERPIQPPDLAELEVVEPAEPVEPVEEAHDKPPIAEATQDAPWATEPAPPPPRSLRGKPPVQPSHVSVTGGAPPPIHLLGDAAIETQGQATRR